MKISSREQPGPVKTEDDPFDPDPPAALRRPVEAEGSK